MLTSFTAITYAQSFEKEIIFGSSANESIEKMQFAREKQVIAGLFDGTLSIDESNISTKGGRDIYLMQLDASGAVEWIKTGGSNANDELSTLFIDDDYNIYILGSFLINAQFDSLQLNSTSGSEAIFICKYDSSGELLWGKSFSSSAAQEATDLVVDENGTIYITGNFGGILILNNQSYTAQATQDAFVLKLFSDGTVDWFSHQGISGKIEPESIVIFDDNKISIAGNYRGSVAFANDTIQTNTNDDDVFLAQYDEWGQPLWIQKAGGVYQDVVIALVQNESGQLFVGGHFRGVMTLSDGTRIETNNIQDQNLFLLEYNLEGQPIDAVSLGGLDEELVRDLCFYNANTIAFLGYFSEGLQLGGYNETANGIIDAFIVGIDVDTKTVQWLETLSGDGIVIGNTIVVDEQEQIYIGGGFNQSLVIDENMYNSLGFYDGFSVALQQSITPVQSLIPTSSTWKVFPNPSQQYINIDAPVSIEKIQLFSLDGRLILSVDQSNQINISLLSDGLYLLQMYSANEVQIQKISIKKG